MDVFNENILPDLRAPVNGSVHPIIKVDALKYLLTFRNQVRILILYYFYYFDIIYEMFLHKLITKYYYYYLIISFYNPKIDLRKYSQLLFNIYHLIII